ALDDSLGDLRVLDPRVGEERLAAEEESPPAREPVLVEAVAESAVTRVERERRERVTGEEDRRDERDERDPARLRVGRDLADPIEAHEAERDEPDRDEDAERSA